MKTLDNQILMHTVYKITFNDGFYYIGLSCDFKRRLEYHRMYTALPYGGIKTHEILAEFNNRIEASNYEEELHKSVCNKCVSTAPPGWRNGEYISDRPLRRRVKNAVKLKRNQKEFVKNGIHYRIIEPPPLIV